ncbi:hypothetical protein [Rhizobium sp. LjRoot258]|uniref:hypothetical protein n=1 Tax=Rhizobium sp. LjRoot258 TaxID=3342299 RepID=UPI003ECF57A6
MTAPLPPGLSKLSTSAAFGDLLPTAALDVRDEPPQAADAAHDDLHVVRYLVGKASEVEEAKHYPIPTASPVEVVKSVMVAKYYSRADLVAVIGFKRAADLLNGKREINLDQI